MYAYALVLSAAATKGRDTNLSACLLSWVSIARCITASSCIRCAVILVLVLASARTGLNSLACSEQVQSITAHSRKHCGGFILYCFHGGGKLLLTCSLLPKIACVSAWGFYAQSFSSLAGWGSAGRASDGFLTYYCHFRNYFYVSKKSKQTGFF